MHVRYPSALSFKQAAHGSRAEGTFRLLQHAFNPKWAL
jgi:hypothetical protein